MAQGAYAGASYHRRCRIQRPGDNNDRRPKKEMEYLKEWLSELLLDTIVAAVVTLLFYIIRLDQTWEDASRTFIMAFLVMLAMGIFRRIKKKKQ